MKQILQGISAILNTREKIKLYQLIIFDLVIGMLDIAFLGALLFVLNLYTKNTAPANISFLPQALMNSGSLTLIVVFFVLFSVKNLFGYIGLKSQHHFFYNVASRLSKRNILNYLSDDYGRFVSIDSSVQIRRISQQPIEFSHYILTNVQQIVSQVILIFFTVCAILFYHPTLFLLLFILLLPPVVLLGWYLRKKLKDVRAHIKTTSEKTLQHLHESLAGYVESNIYDKDDFFTNRYSGYQDQLNENIATQQTLQSLPSRLVEIFAVLGFLILVVINKLSADAPAINMLTVGVFMAAAYKIIPGIVKILNSTGQMKTYQFTLTDLLPAAKQETVSNTPPESIKSIGFENISFKYKEHEIINNLSFKLVPGDLVGISGNSGMGKTTIINLLLGFITSGNGHICINNKPAGPAQLTSYRQRISYVKQQPFFINDSIVKNITLSEDGFDNDKLNEVIAVCGIDKLLEKYPEGLEKVINENGKNISGGQRQRIMLARALYHDFDLLILDEPFSEMDGASEREILKQMQLLTRQGKMILFITHNKASLEFCNKIITLDEA
ncbi:ABC transporter ATP-binding protein/permease [Mucilaginibacter sp. BJC16-A38]|uniref:ATP-binding cassette domain-containing protein n=1 Tax=Mucilaginibacter phenanthrenivorans TaxID=1234842 RepID=UPI0021584AC9|nr:ABC transporter ATP-binding protein [Mucilaginibacter phenanthrenivorans]MCR8559971.1 ABC transporter ATP-binding protein/permease [Mucilaginibacter phenanthrenivorans]